MSKKKPRLKHSLDHESSSMYLKSRESPRIELKRNPENLGPSASLGSDPGLSTVSVSSDRSKEWGIGFERNSENSSPFASLGSDPGLSSVSVSSNRSKEWGIGFKRDSLNHGPFTISGSDSDLSSVSARSDRSKEWGIEFQSREIVKSESRTRGTSGLKSRPSEDPNCVSLRSGMFKDLSNVFQRDSENPCPFANLVSGLSSVSVSSDRSKEWGIGFKRDSLNHGPFTISVSNPDVSSVSVRSDRSKEWGIEFQRASENPNPFASLGSDPGLSYVSVSSDRSKEWGIGFKREESCPEHPREDLQTQLDHVFKLLEQEILTFVKKQLKSFNMALVSENPECCDSEENEEHSSKEAFLQITLNFLRRMNQEQLAESLQKSCIGISQDKLKRQLQQKFSHVSEGIAKGNLTFLNHIYTELHITKGEFNKVHETSHMESFSKIPTATETIIKCEDLFEDTAHTPHREELTEGPSRAEQGEEKKPIQSRFKKVVGYKPKSVKERPQTKRANVPIRTVITKGVAGIGKTVLTWKFSLDWAEGKSNQNIKLLFPFSFRELNVLRDRHFSLVGLLHHCFGESAGFCHSEFLQVLFIFDGLDECRLPLNFTQTRVLRDPTESVTVDVLLVNLIRGSLLPSARIWITTRPAAANQIPAKYISLVTEVQGFSDPQKEEYFRKRFEDEQQAAAIISHIKSSHLLYSLCYIPIFCWILSTVSNHVMETGATDQLPQTLCQMYILFLVVQAKVKNLKYDGRSETDAHWTPETKKMVLSLGKLAFEQLQKGNLIFYDSDLSECGLGAVDASVYSGVFTQVFREEQGLYQDKIYCFIHLSVQEFLAALYVHEMFFNSGVDLLSPQQTSERPYVLVPNFVIEAKYWSEAVFYRSAVDLALQSPNGHLDLFLRFLLGLSLPVNQRLLQGLLAPTESSPDSHQMTVTYLKEQLNKGLSPEKSLNLLHCLNELNDHSLVEQIQRKMREGSLFHTFISLAEWSAMAYILLSSDSDLQEFDLRKYQTSEIAFLGLLPVVKASNKVILSGCNLSGRSCDPMSSVLRSSCLTHLDLSKNNLDDSGVKLLCSGLKSATCSLETLSLSGCRLFKDSCSFLSSVLSSSSLIHLDLSNNDLEDSGVQQLCSGLKSPTCRLETLRLSGCLVSERGGTYLASALSSAHSCLKELDLSYNHPGASAEILIAVRDDPLCKLDTLRLDPAGEMWMVPGLRKYSCEFSLDPSTASEALQLSGNLRSVTGLRRGGSYGLKRCKYFQVLSSTGLTGRCYWEVEWSGMRETDIGVTLGQRGECRFGDDDQSWALRIMNINSSFHHNNIQTQVNDDIGGPGRVGVFLDSEAGSLSFYRILPDGNLHHIHTFNSTFNEPLFPGFGLGPLCSSWLFGGNFSLSSSSYLARLSSPLVGLVSLGPSRGHNI